MDYVQYLRKVPVKAKLKTSNIFKGVSSLSRLVITKILINFALESPKSSNSIFHFTCAQFSE